MRVSLIEGDSASHLKPASTAVCPCKICGGPAALYGVVDFHKSCNEMRGVRFSLSGVPIYYRRCADCKFLFTDAFDDWNDEQFKTYIYPFRFSHFAAISRLTPWGLACLWRPLPASIAGVIRLSTRRDR
jgi:hypothetical protein